MPRSVHPLVYMHWTNLKTYAATFAKIPVNRYVGSAYTEFLGRFHRPPDSNTFLFANFLPVLLEIRVNRQSLLLSEMASNYLLDQTAYKLSFGTSK